MLSRSSRRFLSLSQSSSLRRSSARCSSTAAESFPFPVAVVGTGPSAFYTAKYLLDQDPRLRIDFFEKLPAPFGLVRYGVAPDHPEVKSVTNTFEEVVAKHRERVRLFANVEVGDESISTAVESETKSEGESETICQNSQRIALATLRAHYSAVVLAYGADRDRALRIPGSDLRGVVSAHDFVNWYNGHPDYAHLHTAPTNARTARTAACVGEREEQRVLDLSKTRHVVIVGQGNVALDCARILAKNVDRELLPTDIAKHAVEELRKSAVETVTVVGRRGHAQAAFTIKELRELTRIDDVALRVYPDELAAGETASTLQELENNRPKTRIVELIKQIATQSERERDQDTESEIARETETHKRQVDIRFLWSPTALSASPTDPSRVGALTVTRTRLAGEPFAQYAVNTEETQRWPCDLLLTSIGYRSRAISDSLPFDHERHVVPNVRGRVTTTAPSVSHTEQESDKESERESETLRGLYVTGWLKRGPIGIIGANITDARETANALVEDLRAERLSARGQDPVLAIAGEDAVAAKVFEHAVTWQEAQRLHEHEVEMGQRQDTPRLREKVVSVADMLRIAKSE